MLVALPVYISKNKDIDYQVTLSFFIQENNTLQFLQYEMFGFLHSNIYCHLKKHFTFLHYLNKIVHKLKEH